MTYALYLRDNQRNTEVVRVMAIHHDPAATYYTVLFSNGRERQTERSRLLFIQ